MRERQAARRVIVSSFLLVIAIMVAITAIGLTRIKNLNADLERMVREREIQIALMHIMRTAARERSLILQSMMIIKDPFTIDDYAMQMSEIAGQYSQAREALLSHPLSSEERTLLEKQHEQSMKTGSSQNRIIDYIRDEDYLSASTLLIYTTLPGQRHAMGMMDQFIGIKQQQNLSDLNTTSTTIKQTYRLILLLGTLGVAFSIGVAGYVSRRINREISRRRTSENELRHSELRERIIRENMIDGVLTLDADGRILSCNKACITIFGYRSEEMLDHSVSTLIPTLFSNATTDTPDQHQAHWEQRMLGAGREVTGHRADGSTFPAELDISKIILEEEPVYISVIRDITEKKMAEQHLQQFNQELERRVVERTEALAHTNAKLRHEIEERVKVEHELLHLANHDSLTGLPNRAMFKQHLEIMLHHATRHNRMMALLFMDLDGFKAINDTRGHEIGDQVLVEVAKRMGRYVRKEDMLARLGGDEFTILLSELKRVGDATVVANKLIEVLKHPIRVESHICQIGISIGISLFPDNARDAEALLRLADEAMYGAKSTGKNRYNFSNHQNTKVEYL